MKAPAVAAATEAEGAGMVVLAGLVDAPAAAAAEVDPQTLLLKGQSANDEYQRAKGA